MSYRILTLLSGLLFIAILMVPVRGEASSNISFQGQSPSEARKAAEAKRTGERTKKRAEKPRAVGANKTEEKPSAEVSAGSAPKGKTTSAGSTPNKDAKQPIPAKTIRVGILGENGKLLRIETLSIEEYLKGVLPREMPPSWNSEALKAQAVAARSYALANLHKHEKDGYDVCNTTHCQVYDAASAVAATNAAISATRGEVLTYGGRIIEGIFHSDSGGMTEDSEAVWGTKTDYLRAVKEPMIKTAEWSAGFTLKEAEQKLDKAGYKIGMLKKVELSKLVIGQAAKDRSRSGRVLSARFVGKKGTKELTGNDLRRIFGLKSTLFEVRLDKKELDFLGYGSGHGLGMSQAGADRLAATKTYKEILAHYYTGTVLKENYGYSGGR
ncbi:SpoIID/LytB domain-containing protein [Selenomonas sp. TAMA-11512]|uniref:SpoIID/LytB domain-containing protein n=1 Tax=Selenomonas sp. TAMA-11512 TaxID=3095337 RepID=UPI0030CB6D21